MSPGPQPGGLPSSSNPLRGALHVTPQGMHVAVPACLAVAPGTPVAGAVALPCTGTVGGRAICGYSQGGNPSRESGSVSWLSRSAGRSMTPPPRSPSFPASYLASLTKNSMRGSPCSVAAVTALLLARVHHDVALAGTLACLRAVRPTHSASSCACSRSRRPRSCRCMCQDWSILIARNPSAALMASVAVVVAVPACQAA